MEVSLASAFRYRNKIKKGNFETKDFDNEITLTLRLMELLNHVNKSISRANEGASDILNDIQTLNAKNRTT